MFLKEAGMEMLKQDCKCNEKRKGTTCKCDEIEEVKSRLKRSADNNEEMLDLVLDFFDDKAKNNKWYVNMSYSAPDLSHDPNNLTRTMWPNFGVSKKQVHYRSRILAVCLWKLDITTGYRRISLISGTKVQDFLHHNKVVVILVNWSICFEGQRINKTSPDPNSDCACAIIVIVATGIYWFL